MPHCEVEILDGEDQLTYLLSVRYAHRNASADYCTRYGWVPGELEQVDVERVHCLSIEVSVPGRTYEVIPDDPVKRGWAIYQAHQEEVEETCWLDWKSRTVKAC